MHMFLPLGFFFSSRKWHTRSTRDWSSDVCSSDLVGQGSPGTGPRREAARLARVLVRVLVAGQSYRFVVVAAAALLTVTLPAAADAPPPGALVDIGSAGACVANMGSAPG